MDWLSNKSFFSAITFIGVSKLYWFHSEPNVLHINYTVFGQVMLSLTFNLKIGDICIYYIYIQILHFLGLLYNFLQLTIVCSKVSYLTWKDLVKLDKHFHFLSVCLWYIWLKNCTECIFSLFWTPIKVCRIWKMTFQSNIMKNILRIIALQNDRSFLNLWNNESL